MSRFAGLIRLTRPVNVLICGISVVAGGSLGGPPLDRIGDLASAIANRGFGNLEPWQWRTLLAALSASLILAAGNVFNDVRDVACDRVNAPGRPIPSGLVSETAASLFAAMLALAGILISLPVGPAAVTIAVAATLLLFWYDVSLKGVPLFGNLAVALLGGLAFLYGGIAGFTPASALVPGVFALLYHFSREVIKDAADLTGDQAAGIRTAATAWGVKTAGRIASCSLILLAVLSLAPFAAGWFGRAYLAAIALLVLPVIAYCIVKLPRSESPEHFHRMSVLLKAGMPAAILAILIGFQW